RSLFSSQLPRLGDRLLAPGVPWHLVCDRAPPAWFLLARRNRKSGFGPRFRHQRPAHGHPHLWLWRRACRTGRCDGGPDLQCLAANGLRYHHRGIRGRGHRRHGLHHGCDRHRLYARHHRRADQGVFPGGLEHGDLHDHDYRAARSPGRTVRTERLMATLAATAPVRRETEWSIAVAGVALVVFVVAAPFVLYPVFIMKALCFALFACAFNLLIGYVGLVSFGHALYFGWAGYLAAHAAKVWGVPPELAVLTGTATGMALGLIAGVVAIRRQGIYFAMITLALAQMMYLVALRVKMTGGEDGI